MTVYAVIAYGSKSQVLSKAVEWEFDSFLCIEKFKILAIEDGQNG